MRRPRHVKRRARSPDQSPSIMLKSSRAERFAPVRWARVLVLGSPDNPTPIGTAYEIGSDDQGLAEWTLNVRNVPVPGRFVIVDREFWLIGK